MYKFLTTNNSLGPKGEKMTIDKIEIGDIDQLRFNGNIFFFFLIIIKNEINTIITLFAVNTYNIY